MATDNLLNNMSYTNKEFKDVYEELLALTEKISYRWNPKESNESDPGVVLLKLCAILADKLNYNIDKNVLECFPVSVTQESNARSLFEQLGYFMGWYKGASGNIQISWKGENTGYVYNLPRFSMVSNDDNSIVYTLTSDVALSSDGSVAQCSAVQGVVQDFMINGDTIITTQNLDSNNRIYFSNYNIAENGIFIENDLFGYDDWKRVNNLEVESYGSPVYKFGVSQDNDVCYLEFPEDAYNIFGNGIRIKYISTDGQDGNVSSKIINKFFNDPSAYYIDDNNDEQSILLTTEDVYITNIDSISNGENPETIQDAYNNYKRTIGTFDTLVTLRDYNNAVRNAKINNINIASNGFVTDRTNDIQCSYKIVTDIQDSSNVVYATEEDSDIPKIDAFGLKLYLLENIQSSGNIVQPSNNNQVSATTYNETFNLMNNTEYSKSYKVSMMEKALEEEKCVQHDFQPLLSDDLCMLKNKYPVVCKIIPQYKLTVVQSNSVKSNIIKALYNNLNARKVEFGDEISYDYLYNIILNSDERIKSVILDDIKYTTYAVYFDSDERKYKEVEINTLNDFIAGYYNPADDEFYYDSSYSNKVSVIDKVMYKDCPSVESETDKVVYVTGREATDILDGTSFKIGTKIIVRFGFDALPSGSGETVLKLQLLNSQSETQVGSKFEIKEQIGSTFQNLSPNKSLCWRAGSKRLLTFNGSYWVIDFESNYSNNNSLYTFVDLPTGTCYKYTTGKADVDIKSEMQLDIWAKSVLGGVTQLLIPDDIFEYRMNQKFVDYVDDISNITTNANIHIESPSGEAEKTLKDNEYIKFYSPNLQDDVTYSSYVKYQYALSQDVDMNSDYMLHGDETITFYWKESDDENAPYKYYKYGAGTIIHPNFSLRAQVGYMSLDENNSRFGVSYSHDEDDIDYIGLKYSLKEGICNYSDSQKLASIYNNDYILSSTKSIIIRKKIEATIEYPMYAYWILNEKRSLSNGKYVYTLFDEEELKEGESSIRQTYILQPGEYLLYTNSAKNSVEILSAGTKLTRTSNKKKVEAMTCEATETDSVIDEGISSIDDYLKQINIDETITATEMQIKTVPANATLYLSALTWEADNSAALSESELTGIRIYGEGNTPTSSNTSLVASSGRVAYNKEYSSSWQWHEDVDEEGNPVYSKSGFLYGTNTDLTTLTDDAVSKTPVMLGLQPGETYVHVDALSAPEFENGNFYDYDSDSQQYLLLTAKPDNWNTAYMNYYWLKQDHAYNPKFQTASVWEDDEKLDFGDRTPYISEWIEDENYLALGYKVEQDNMFPDLVKIKDVPTMGEQQQNGVVDVGTDKYYIGQYWSYRYPNGDEKSLEDIQNIITTISSNKYFKSGNDWYLNKRYSGDMSQSLSKNTYHAYNPKFRFLGYVWNESTAQESDGSKFIEITGENCSPQRCILLPKPGLLAYMVSQDETFVMVYKAESYEKYWQKLNQTPADSNSGNTLRVTVGTVDDYNNLIYLNSYTYLCIANLDTEFEWYQSTFGESGSWVNVTGPTYTLEQLRNNKNAIEIAYGTDNINNGTVSIVPKEGLKAVNIPTENTLMDGYAIKYFECIEDYMEKSWTQRIRFSQSAIELSGNSYITPETENIPVSVGEHAYHQYDSVVWLEDYSYAFEDNVSSGTSNVIGNSRSVSGVGVTPMSEGIVATQDGKAYNPAYSYEYYWKEDSSYQNWSNPIAVLSGQNDPYKSNISVLALDQHVISPDYISGYVWIRLNSIPSKYTNNVNLYIDVQKGKVIVYSSSDTAKTPPFDANSYPDAQYAFNDGVNPSVWYQKTPIYGKSWTSARKAIGKSWTAYDCTVNDSWTAINEYIGKSWHSQKDNIPMLWRSVPTSINVIFRKDGAEILSPQGYELNDFTIKSKLQNSSEVEEWSKVIVDDGWEAYSSLDLSVSPNSPFEVYENQEIEWFSKDYDKYLNNNSETHGYINGRYIYKENVNLSIREYDDIIYRVSVSNVVKKSDSLIECNLLPANNIHMYCKELNKSWTSVSEEVQSDTQHWEEDVSYQEYGVQIVDVSSTSQSSIHARVHAQQFVALVDGSNNYVSKYIPIYVLSDFGYDIEGGNMIDVSRFNIEGNIQYMDIYSYEMSEYQDDDFEMDGNMLKISTAYSEYVKNKDSTWISRMYYRRTGNGTALDPYDYYILTAKPSDWDVAYTNYYVKTNKLDDNYSITKEFDFNFNSGKYLLLFTNSSPDIESLKLYVAPVVNGEIVDSEKIRLTEFGDSNFNDFSKSRKYYVVLDIEMLKSTFVSFSNAEMLHMYIDMKFKTPILNYYETTGYIGFDLSYKYDKPDWISDDFYTSVINRMRLLDRNKMYDYSYVVDKDILIKNPVDSGSFLNSNHIYNKFTICQIDTENSDIYITNSTK